MALDRRRQIIDVMERVLGAVHDDQPHADVVELDIKPGMLASTISVVQVNVIGRERERG